jgi:hypothetical protein
MEYAANEGIADAQRSFLNQNRGNGPATTIQLGLNDRPTG